ncbi:MAG: fused MFS/spermidine synthase [Elusimicrobiota bacterium]
MERFLYLLFFLSGACGLAYETLWAKYLALSLGHAAHAYAVVLAGFLGGLALGNAWLGPIADRVGNRLLLYARLELGIGLFGLISPFLLGALSSRLMQAPFALRAGAAFAAILLPTILMGGTLPALTRLLTSDLSMTDRSVSRLYSLNSAGGVAGTLLAAFALIPGLGLDLSTSCAAGMNILIGLACLFMSRRSPAHASNSFPRDAVPCHIRGTGTFLLAAVFVSGFVSLSYEVAWTRLLALSLGASTYSFSIMLAAFISGIALGSWLIARRASPIEEPARVFGLVEMGIAVSLALCLPLYPYLPYLFYRLQGMLQPVPETFLLHQGLRFAACWLLTLLPTAFIGATLPLACKAVAESGSGLGRRVGQVFAWNTAGNVLGALCAGLFLMPWLGLKGLLAAGMLLNWLVGAIVIASSGKRRFLAPAVSLIPVLLYLVFSVPWDKNMLTSGAYRMRRRSGHETYRNFKRSVDDGKIVYYRDDGEASVAVVETPDGDLLLKINGKTDASSGGDMQTQVLCGQLPLLLRPDAKSVLVVGLGSGVTAGSALTHPIRSLDVAEISPAVVEAERFFAPHNRRALADPRLRLHVEDARVVLASSRGRYDAVISEPSNPWLAGIGGLYTSEFYGLAKSRLNPGGVMLQWVHNYEMSDDVIRLVLRTFASSFEHVALWAPRPEDMLLVGSSQPLEPGFEAMRRRFEEPAVSEDLKRIGIRRFATVLSLNLASDPDVRLIAGQGPLNEDRFPVLEYEAPKAFYSNEPSNLIRGHDARLAQEARPGLFLPLYLSARGQGLSREEFKDAAEYHGRFEYPLHRLYVEEWLRRFPRDEDALWASSMIDAGMGRLPQARVKLRALLSRRPKDPELLSALAVVERGLALENRSFLGQAGRSEP